LGKFSVLDYVREPDHKPFDDSQPAIR